MEYDGRILNPTEEEFNRWLSTQTMRGTVGTRRLSDLAQLTPEQLMAMQRDNANGGDVGVTYNVPQLPQQQPPQQMNTIRNNATGRVIDMNYATKPLRELTEADQQAAIEATGGRRTTYDVHIDGPREVARRQLPDGRTEVIREYPALKPTIDGRLNQTSKLVREIETPAYLNPAETKRLQYEKLSGEARKANLSPEEEARKVGMVEEAKTEAAKKAAAARAKIPGTIEFKRASELQKTAHGAEATKNYAVSQANEVEGALAGILGVTPEELPALLGGKDGLGKAEKRTEAATGVLDVLTPTIFQNTANVEEQTERLRSLSQMMGLTALRKSGVAPGTITEREWPKFGAQLGNLSLRLGDKEFVRELANIYKKTQEMRQTGQLDYEKIVSELQQSGEQQPAQGQPMQRPSNAQGQAQAIQEAMAAIQRGAPKEAVMQRLREMGIQ